MKLASVEVLQLVHKVSQVFWEMFVMGEYLSILLKKKLKFFLFPSNAQIFILILILFTIAVQPVYVLLTHQMPIQHVVLMLIDVKGKYCYM